MSIPDFLPLDQFRDLDWMSSRFPRPDRASYIKALEQSISNIESVLGLPEGARNLGEFSGTIIPDNSSLKVALQALETALADVYSEAPVVASSEEAALGEDNRKIMTPLRVFEVLAPIRDNISSLGLAEGDTTFGEFSGTVIPENSTAKQALQAVATYAQTIVSNLLGSTALTGAGMVALAHLDTVQPGTLAAAWQFHANPMNRPFNAAGDGVTDDTAAVQACIDFLARHGGGVVDLDHPHLIDSADLNVTRFVSLRMRLGTGSVGNPSFFGHGGDANTPSAYEQIQNAPKIILNPAYKVNGLGSQSFENIIFSRKGLALDGSDLADNYAGEALRFTATSGVSVRRCTFLGFNQGSWSDGSSQVRFEQSQFDCLNGIRFTNGWDLNAAVECRAYNFLQSDVDGFDARTKRDGKAYLCDGAGNGGHMFINCFAYGYRWAFSMETQGSYLLQGCWADGGRVEATGKSYWTDGVGFNLISGNTAANAECQVVDCKFSAQNRGIFVGPGMYGATLISGFHSWECNEGIVISTGNVQVSNGAIRGHFTTGITFINAASASTSSLIDIIFYDRQAAPNTPVEISFSTGSPHMRNVRYIGAPMTVFGMGVYKASIVSEFLSTDDNREVVFVDDTGVIGDMGPKLPGIIRTLIFTADNVTSYGGPDGASTFYNATSGGNFKTKSAFKATANSSITFYRNAGNTRWIEMSRTLF